MINFIHCGRGYSNLLSAVSSHVGNLDITVDLFFIHTLL